MIKKLTSLRSVSDFKSRMAELDLDLPIEETILKAEDSPLAQPLKIGSFQVGNRYCIHPMEGWDATKDGKPTDLLKRRWERFGISGAKFIWGFEAMSLQHEGRANPHQLVLNDANFDEIYSAAEGAVEAHEKRFGTSSDLLWGFQLTHSGRFSRPNDDKKLEPTMLYSHPILNKKFGFAEDHPVLSDDDIKILIDLYVKAAVKLSKRGMPFVDIKQCHGYLGHEFLSAFSRPGIYGGESLENRTRFSREIIQGIKQLAPELNLGVRLSAFDFVSFRPDPAKKTGKLGAGIPDDFSNALPYKYGFGVNPENPIEYDLTEPIAYLKLLKEWGADVVNVSCGSPYYNPHIQRPAIYPPSDGYSPANDPIIDVNRQIQVVKALKESVPQMPLVSSGLTYLQEFLPQVSQALVRKGWTDSIGIGRMVLSYPQIVAHSLERGEIERKFICRTFSDCTTAPRNGITSGCYPLDEYYKKMPEAKIVKELKAKKINNR